VTKPEVFIVGGARTPMTDYVGALKDLSALELGAIAARGAFEKYGVKPEWIEHAVIGNVLQTSSDAIYGARHVALKAGVPVEVPALTVNRLCGSGIQAAVSGAQMIQLGEAGLVLTGGVESMSQAPHVIRGLRGGLKLGQGKLEDYLWESLLDPYCGCTMAMTAENCGAKYGISREAQDAFALRSQQLADAAWKAGRFAYEIVSIDI
jgi:acetyl-CoA acetyltransferase family protein